MRHAALQVSEYRYVTLMRLSVCLSVVVCTKYIVAKRCVLEQNVTIDRL